jgi:hypothetical protein
MSTRRIVAPSQRARTTLSLAGPYAGSVCPGNESGSAGAVPNVVSGSAALESGGCARARPAVATSHAESARATAIALALRNGASLGTRLRV